MKSNQNEVMWSQIIEHTGRLKRNVYV